MTLPCVRQTALRSLLALAGVAVAGALVWLAVRVVPVEIRFERSATAHWASVALIAGAGLAAGLARLAGAAEVEGVAPARPGRPRACGRGRNVGDAVGQAGRGLEPAAAGDVIRPVPDDWFRAAELDARAAAGGLAAAAPAIAVAIGALAGATLVPRRRG